MKLPKVGGVEMRPWTQEEIKACEDSMRESMKRIDEKRKPKTPVCRFCGSHNIRALNSNGIRGPGYAVRDYVCKDCGRVL